eukprot:Gregarina_sp_Pseudo_9__302@NODE_1196_length_1787_cov_939_425057_g1122_i0_p1_GENE_NODE_1196_length_1787_cov_939_425057_g1122_i0NODE_1196_length_1787_cov_939_425057_g1122_i0_p1_ORF_typecomplete_len246_score55_43TAXi_N/PF14543_6/0_23TAXi_N/PF14543_6/2_5e03_NODE_1196_length_1787_cov_939_425057_g1122_i08121549
MFSRFACFAAVVTAFDPHDPRQTYYNFVITSDTDECKIEACQQVPGAQVLLEEIEACVDAVPTTCSYEVSYVRESGSTETVCSEVLGFDLAEQRAPVGVPIAWIANHTPITVPKQDVFSGQACTYDVFATDSCEASLASPVMSLSVTHLPFQFEISSVPIDPATETGLPKFLILQNTGAPDANCDTLMLGADFNDIALLTRVSGRKAVKTAEGDGDARANGDAAPPQLLTATTSAMILASWFVLN